jgi:3-hydroxy-9,10-secoandrosta-1,3,5(10)-triene-9,17-dione monooxygenase
MTLEQAQALTSEEEMVSRASGLIPLLRKNARLAETERRVPDENVAAMIDAGILRMFRPRCHGGLDFPVSIRTKTAVLAELAQGCASTAWAATIWVDINWLASFFPAAAQEEVYADPDVLMTATLNPGGTATSVTDGYVLNGTWRFNSGSSHAQWCAQPAIATQPDGSQEPLLFMLPYDQLRNHDDWDVTGLRGTASNTVSAENLFVPAHRTLSLIALMTGQATSSDDGAAHKVHPTHFINSSIAPTAIGLAKSAVEHFMDRLPGRGITYTTYPSQIEAPVTHLQVGDAALKLSAAELLVYKLADLVDERSNLGGGLDDFSLEERGEIRGATGYTVRLCAEATEGLRKASGATSIMHEVPIQRVARDMQALEVHGLASPNTVLELYGRILCGLEPNSNWV